MPPINIVILRLSLALVLGGIIGAEREYRNKSAGFRTMIMIALGACLYTLFSVAIGMPGNPDRIASNIVTGIGFLGAGIIFKADDRVRGLTTAAAIWFTAALGMGVGAGYYWTGVAGCGVGIVILGLFSLVEEKMDKLHVIRSYRIVSDFDNTQISYFENVFRQYHLKCKCSQQLKKEGTLTSTWKVKGKSKNHHRLVDAMMGDIKVKEFEY